MSTYTITSKSHDEWLRSRREGIGSSEVATILGLNPYETPYQLWLRKTGQVQEVEQENFLMKAGHYLEDAISRFCADEVGLDIVKNSASEFVVIDRDKSFMRVSPDRYAYPTGSRHTADNKVIIECKSTQKPVDPDNLSKYWFCQVMYQLRVTRIPLAYIAWLTQGRDFGFRPIFFDPEFSEFIEEEVERFWVDCVLGGREPALVSVQDVLIKYPRHEEGKTLTADSGLLETWSELKATNDEIKRLESVKESLENTIKTSMCDAERLIIPASEGTEEKTLISWKTGKPTQRFDSGAFKKADPDTYSKYLRESEGSRRFIIK